MSILSRFSGNIVLFISAIIFPWWLAVALSIYLFFKFDNYIELIILGLIFDILYGVDTSDTITGLPVLSVIGLSLFIILSIFKKRMRTYV